MFEFVDGLIYHEETKIIGEIENIDFKAKVVGITDGEKSHKFDLSTVKYLAKVGTMHGESVYDHDVLVSGDDRQFLLVLNPETGNLRIDLLNNSLEVIEEGKAEFRKTDIQSLEKFLQIEDNYYVLLSSVATVDFNIKVVKTQTGRHFYACNNKDNELVDLISVVFIGQHLIEEEDYTRQEYTYDEYIDFLEHGSLIEVSEQEFERYARDVIFGNHNNNSHDNDSYAVEDDIDFDDYDDEDEDDYYEDDDYQEENKIEIEDNTINDVIAQHWEKVRSTKDNDLNKEDDEDNYDDEEDDDEDW